MRYEQTVTTIPYYLRHAVKQNKKRAKFRFISTSNTVETILFAFILRLPTSAPISLLNFLFSGLSVKSITFCEKRQYFIYLSKT
jgi:hypothetical protein